VTGQAAMPAVRRGPFTAASSPSLPHPPARFLLLAAAATAMLFGLAFYSQWDRLLRVFWHQSFGLADPIYARDIGFYLFDLPFLTLLQKGLLTMSVGGTSILAFAYLRMGALTPGGGRFAVDLAAMRHVIGNVVLLLAALAWGFYLDRFGLLTRSGGAVFGAGYTDVHFVLVGLWVALGATLALICVLIWAAVVNAPRAAALGLGGYLVILLAALAVIPWGVQHLVVEPNELELETPFLQSNIAFTRQAYGLDKIEVRLHTSERKLETLSSPENKSTIENIRIWDH